VASPRGAADDGFVVPGALAAFVSGFLLLVVLWQIAIHDGAKASVQLALTRGVGEGSKVVDCIDSPTRFRMCDPDSAAIAACEETIHQTLAVVLSGTLGEGLSPSCRIKGDMIIAETEVEWNAILPHPTMRTLLSASATKEQKP